MRALKLHRNRGEGQTQGFFYYFPPPYSLSENFSGGGVDCTILASGGRFDCKIFGREAPENGAEGAVLEKFPKF